MDIQRQAFESHFKTTEIYKREAQIRQKDILEFSSNFGYFNIIANNAWEMWQQAQKVAVPEGYVVVLKHTIETLVTYGSSCASEYDIDDLHEAVNNYKAMIEAVEKNDE